MEKQNFVHDFQQKLLEMFRASPAADLERNIKALMGQTFNKLELVTRDEFEIQVELLRDLRTRVTILEKRLAGAPGAAATAYAGHSAASGASAATGFSAAAGPSAEAGRSAATDLPKESGKPTDPFSNPSES